MTIPAEITLPVPEAELPLETGPFEGPEKLLEVWFAPSLDALPDIPESSTSGQLRVRPAGVQRHWRGLRRVPRDVWEEMLDIVKCKVLSVVEGEELDAYLLRWVSRRVRTSDADGTLKRVELVRGAASAHTQDLWNDAQPAGITPDHRDCTSVLWLYNGLADGGPRCFYSRKSFFFPERQSGPHRDWRDEVLFLDSVFGSAGSAYTVGPMNRDHWLLYLTSPNSQPLLPSDASLITPFALSLSLTADPSPPSTYQDSTLEILMSHLSPSSREEFYHTDPETGHDMGTSISTRLGIDKLFPPSETTLDSFGFEPCGYSANAVIGSGMPSLQPDKPGGGYFTIHVTPEEGWSYASFECNVPLPITKSGPASRPDLASLIRNVVGIFQPNRLSITLFVSTAANEIGLNSNDTERRAWEAFGSDLLGGGFERKDRIGYEFDGYDLVFACFQKRGWVEPKPIKANGVGPVGAKLLNGVNGIREASAITL